MFTIFHSVPFYPSSTHLLSKHKSQDSFMSLEGVSDLEVLKSRIVKNYVRLMNVETK